MSAVRRVPALALAVATVVGSLSLVACGSDEAAAPKAPCGLTDTRKGHLTVKNVVDALEKAAKGRKTVSFREEMTIGGKTAAIEGTVDASPDKIYALSQTMPGDDGTVKLILKDDKVYVSAEGEQDGKYYVVDPDQKGDPLAAPLKAWFDQAGASASVSAWTVGLLAVNYVKDETLDDGTPTELYEFQVDPRLAARASGVTPPPGLAQSATSYVWIDRYNLIRKVETTAKDERTVETFTNYCEPVDIEAPAASDLIQR